MKYYHFRNIPVNRNVINDSYEPQVEVKPREEDEEWSAEDAKETPAWSLEYSLF